MLKDGLKGWLGRSRRLLAGVALCGALAAPLLTASPAEAAWVGWHGGWGWHAGWGFRPGIVVGVPPVVVGAPVYAPAPYHWIPAHYTRWGAFVPGHWGY